MTARMTPSQLAANIYGVLDHVLESGTAVEIVRSGRILRIVLADETKAHRLDHLEEHPDAVDGDPEDLVHLNWSAEWRR